MVGCEFYLGHGSREDKRKRVGIEVARFLDGLASSLYVLARFLETVARSLYALARSLETVASSFYGLARFLETVAR